MTDLAEQRRRIPFPFDAERAAFQRSFNASVSALLREMQKTFLSSDNFLGYNHGRRWKSHAVAEGDSVGEFTPHTAEIVTKFDDIIAGDLSIISKTTEEILRCIQAQFMKVMYSAVEEASEKSGNIVSAKSSGSKAQAFLEMLKKIEFGVDRDGRPLLPEIHASPEVADAMLKELSNQGPEFQAEVERTKRKKIEAALQREEDRMLKFKKRSTDE